MAYRREMLGGAGCLTVVSVAGCLSDLENTDDEDNTPDQEPIDRSHDTTNTDDDEPDDLSERENISSLYESANRSYTRGFVSYIDAVAWYNNEEFTRAKLELIDAKMGLESANENISEALNVAEEIDHAAAISILEDSEEVTDSYYQAAVLLDEAAEQARDGNLVKADEKSQEANKYREDIDSGIEDQEVLDSALGLD